MRLEYPFILFLLLLIIPLLWWQLRRKSSRALLFSDNNALRKLPRSWAVRLQPLLPFLYTAGLVALVIAMARPQKGLDEERLHTEAVDMVLLLDCSTSMRASDFSQNNRRISRINSAKNVMQEFIKQRPDDRLGLVAFAAMPYVLAPLTLDHGWLIERMDWVKTGMLEDGTAIGDALASAVNRLQDSEAKTKLVILLTDGANNSGELSPANAAQVAKALGIKVYTIGVGSERRRAGFFSVPTDAMDEESLIQIAKTTGGKFYRARDLEGLRSIYREIDKLEKTQIEVTQYTSYKELFQPFAVAGILLLGLEKLLAFSRLGRLPQ